MNFEIHHRFFADKEAYAPFNTFFNDVIAKLKKQAGDAYSLTLNSEDEYLYILAHAYKHYKTAGVGIKILSDIYLYRKRISLNSKYIKRSLVQLGILEFAETLETVADKVFAGENEFSFSDLNAKDRIFVIKLLNFGAFGSAEEFYFNRYKEFTRDGSKRSKLKFYKRRLFPNMEPYKREHPILYKYKILHPLLYIYRFNRSVFVNRRRVKQELKTVFLAGKNKNRTIAEDL